MVILGISLLMAASSVSAAARLRTASKRSKQEPTSSQTAVRRTMTAKNPVSISAGASSDSAQRTGGYVTLSSYYRLPGERFSVRGFQFEPRKQLIVDFAGIQQQATTDESGGFSTNEYIVPYSAIGRTLPVTVSGVAPAAAEVVVGTFYPFVEPSAYFAHVGEQATFHGSRFGPDEPVGVKLGSSDLMNIIADSSGNFNTSGVSLPEKAGTAAYVFTGKKSGTSYTVRIAVGAIMP